MKTWIMENQGLSALIFLALVAGIVAVIVYFTSDDEKEEVEPHKPIAITDVEESPVITRITPNQYRTAMARQGSSLIMPRVSGAMSGARVNQGGGQVR